MKRRILLSSLFILLLFSGAVLLFPSLYTPSGMKGMLEEVAMMPPPEGRVLTDLVYKERLLYGDLTLDIYYPFESAPEGEPVPVMVYIHGGSWLHGNKSTIRVVEPFVNDLREKGIAVVALDYTDGPAGGLKAPVENCRAALAWLRDRGVEYGLDPYRLGLYGASAGAHLAMMTIPFIQEESGLELKFLLEEFGPVDLKAMAAGDAFGASSIFHIFSEETLERYSPLTYVNGDWPPVLMFHGTEDSMVSINQTRMLDESLDEAGVPHIFRIVPGGDHGFFNQSRDMWRTLEKECVDFLLPLVFGPEASGFSDS